MKLAVLADIHDNIWNLAKALPRLSDCDELLCLGDLCSPFTLTAIAEGFAGTVHLVWGNNDGDKLFLTRSADKAGDVRLYGDLAQLTVDGRLIGLTHYPSIAATLADSGRYDLVCHGHDHERKMAHVAKTVLLNPGEIMGRLGVASYAVYDTRQGTAEIVEL